MDTNTFSVTNKTVNATELIIKLQATHCRESYLNMAVTISQVRERTPIQIQGIVTVFRNWLNWWYVNAAMTKF